MGWIDGKVFCYAQSQFLLDFFLCGKVAFLEDVDRFLVLENDLKYLNT